MPSSIRLPVQVGTSSLGNLGRAAAALVPGAALAVAGGLRVAGGARAAGAALAAGGCFLVAFALAQARHAFRTRAADAILDDAGLAIEGGAHHGLRLAWAEIDPERTRAETIEESRLSVARAVAHGVFVFFSAIFANTLEAAPDSPVPLRRLFVVTRDGRTFRLAEAEHPAEQRSLDALLGTIQARLARSPSPPVVPPSVLVCAGCGAPLAPDDVGSVRCPACGRSNPVPEDLRGRLRAHRSVAEARRATEGSVRALLDQPGAPRTNGVLVAGAAVCALAWAAAVLPLLSFGVRRAATFEVGWMLASGLLATLAVFFLARASLSDRRALRLLATGFGARAPAGDGGGARCRRCGAPLPVSGELVQVCAYCDAENVLGIDLRPDVAESAEHALSLADMLAARGRERASRRWLAAAALLGALVAGGLSAISIAVAREHEEHAGRCAQGNGTACLRAGADFDLAILGDEDDPEALRWYVRGCDLGEAEACHRAANLLRWGNGVPAVPHLERQYRDRACRLGFAEACAFED